MKRALLLLLSAACGSSTPAPGTGGGASSSDEGLFREGDVVAYRVKSAAGAAIGRVHSTYHAGRAARPCAALGGRQARACEGDNEAGEKIEVHTRLAIDPNTSGQGEVSIELVTTLRPDGSPLAFKRLSSLEGRYELRFQDRAASVITGEGAREVKYARAPIVPLPRWDMMMLAIALERAKLQPGSAGKLTVLSPETIEPIEQDARAWSDAEERTIVQLSDGKATLAENGRVLRFEEADTGFVLEREDPPGDPPRIDPPTEPVKYVRPAGADWSDREVAIDLTDGQLAGTLSEPRLRANLERRGAPGVVFLSGAGAQDRHGFGAGVDTGTWQILDRLVENGFAVLRIDDRGAGRSTSAIAPAELGTTQLVADAERMVAFLRAQPGVDPERIFVIGHGLGGVTAMLLAEKDATLAGVALLATPFRTLPELIVAREVEARGANRDAVDREVRLAIAALRGNQASRAQVTSQRLAELAKDKQLLLDHASLDVPKVLQAIAKLEISVFQGMKDFQVSWRDDAKQIIDTLKKHGNKRAKLFAYENVDHLMKEEPGTSSLRRYTDRSRRVDERVLADLTAWLLERAK